MCTHTQTLAQACSTAPIRWGFWPSVYQIAWCGDERSGEAEGVRVSSLLQTCVNIVGDQRAGPRTCRSYLGEKQRKMGSLSIHVLRFTQCSGLGEGGVEQSATEGNTPTADEGENKGLERQKTFTDGGTRQRETELEIAQTEKDTIGGEQGR